MAESKLEINFWPISSKDSFMVLFFDWLFLMYLEVDSIYNSDIDLRVKIDRFSSDGWSLIKMKKSSIWFFKVFKNPEIVVSFNSSTNSFKALIREEALNFSFSKIFINF